MVMIANLMLCVFIKIKNKRDLLNKLNLCNGISHNHSICIEIWNDILLVIKAKCRTE